MWTGGTEGACKPAAAAVLAARATAEAPGGGVLGSDVVRSLAGTVPGHEPWSPSARLYPSHWQPIAGAIAS
jgi:hypothetical protein